MTQTIIGFAYLVFCFGSAIVGMWLGGILPASHLSKESKDSIKVATGLIATMSALVLGLITASAKSSFDSIDTEVKQSSAKLLALDRVLARYGPETASIRTAMKESVARRIAIIWPDRLFAPQFSDPIQAGTVTKVEEVGDSIRNMLPKDESQKSLQSRAIELAEALLEERWQIFASSAPSVSMPFILILLFWLSITFLSFGIFAPRDPTVYVAFFVCALSVASSIFLLLELDGPFDGLVKTSPEPLRYAYTHLNK